jgi:hypothetical protein
MLSSLKKNLDLNFLFLNILVPVIALALYCFSFGYLSSRFLSPGVNYFFVTKLTKYLLIIIAATLVASFVVWRIKPGSSFSLQRSSNRFYPADLFLLFLPLTPVAQYILTNQATLSTRDSLSLMLLFTCFSAIYIVIIPALLGTIMQTRTLMIVGLAFVFTIVSMPSISQYFHWFEKGALRKQLPILVGVFLVVWLFYILGQRRILYSFIIASFVFSTSTQWLQKHANRSTSVSMEGNKLLTFVGKRKPAVTPDIYLLLYDAYVPNETMMAYGIDNSAQEDYLAQQGFKLYSHTYSIAPTTLSTMSRVLNASTEFYGPARIGVSGNGVVQRLLKGVGYKTYGLFYSDFMFTGVGSHYDVSIPAQIDPPYERLLNGILVGEFRFNIENQGFGDLKHKDFVKGKQNIFKSVHDEPIFIYMHTNLPTHSQTSGACRPNETDLFKDRLVLANVEMRQDIELIVQNDPNAIVIVAGDHGPHLTRNCSDTTGVYDLSQISRLDIQDRHATFLAIRWPTGDFVKYDDITVLQDLFPAVFAYLYKDPALLQARIQPVIPSGPYSSISGASVDHGIIKGGINDGEPLFLSGR